MTEPDEMPGTAAGEDQLRALSHIMEKAHMLAEIAWPRDATGASEMPEDGLMALIDIQETAAKALGLPEGLQLMTGNTAADIEQDQ